VEEQFDSCHGKYKENWKKYMNSRASEEDELGKIYSENLYGCIVKTYMAVLLIKTENSILFSIKSNSLTRDFRGV
jgi:hypothetical protein